MTNSMIVLAHGGHGGGGTMWLLIPLAIVGLLLWATSRRSNKRTPPRDLKPREGSEPDAPERDGVDGGE